MIGSTISHYKSTNHRRVFLTSGCDLADPDESALADEEGTPS